MSINSDQVNLMFKMLIPSTLNKKEKGDFFEVVTACLFKRQRWEINRNVREPGVQIDIELEGIDTKEKAAVECKFHKDKIGSDEVSKIISILSSYDYSRGFLLSASELDGEAKKLADNFNKKNDNKLTVWSGEQLVEIFTSSYNIEKPNLDILPSICISRMTFLITHDQEFIWVAEHIDPILENSYAFIFPVNKYTKHHSIDYWKNYFDQFKIYQKYHLELIDKNNHNFTFSSTLKSEFKEIPISRIMNADKFDEYHLPCNPQDFFGRVKPREIFWKFLQDVKNSKTNFRIVCLTGNTGMGKSSLLVKLIQESSQEKYKDIYIRDIDITAVRDDKVKYFIVNAIQKTLQESIDKEFVKISNHKVQVDSLESPFFESSSIKLLRRKIIQEGKVIVIFFDQFEEVLTKKSWLSIYKDFTEVAQEINDISENIVLGFSWREDINISLKIFALLKRNLSKQEVADKLDLTYKGDGKSTIENAIQDLQKFLNIQTKKNSGVVEIDNNIIQLNDNQIAEIFADYLSSHLLIQELYRKYDNEQCFHYNDFDQILLKNNYVSSSGDPKDYRSRFLSWFCFAGLLEIRQDEWIYIPVNFKQGKQKGKADECVFKSKRRKDKSQGRYRQLNALDFLK